MKTVNSISAIVRDGWKSILLVDAQDCEVMKYRKMYPTLNIRSAPQSWLTDDAFYHNEGCGTAVVLSPEIRKYQHLIERGQVFVCLELVGGLS